MEFEHRYFGRTRAESGPVHSELSFAPDLLRPPTFFQGQVDKRLPFREGMAALHAVVVSDHRTQQKDRTEYLQWRQQQDDLELADLLASVPGTRRDLTARAKQLRTDLERVNRERARSSTDFYKAQREYFNWLWKNDRGAWYVLDPVVTVHPDQVFFECFSQDESAYARFGCAYDTFRKVGAFECGTTNVDYSKALAAEFEKLRTYRDTELMVDPAGFTVQTDQDAAHHEKKIDLPDGWVRGFLQVSAAMTLPGARLRLDPIDLHNLLFVLKRKKERSGPRSLRFRFSPEGEITVDIEPFGITQRLSRSRILDNRGADGGPISEVRVWGRRRLMVLERLIPVARHLDVTLLGTGLPSFWVARLGGMDFTLGLSGWTANDWSRAGAFDLMAPRGQVDTDTSERVYQALRQTWFADPTHLAVQLDLARATVEAALMRESQAGRVVYDVVRKVYRARELFGRPLPLDQLRFSNDHEARAYSLVAESKVLGFDKKLSEGKFRLSGQVQDPQTVRRPTAILDADDRLVAGTCTCGHYIRNRLHYGPCAHILALRMTARDRGVTA
jgi:hypothetical protein